MKISQNLRLAFGAIVILWLVYFANQVTIVDLRIYGIIPRHPDGLWGILAAPFLHGDMQHLIANSGVLFILLTVSAFLQPGPDLQGAFDHHAAGRGHGMAARQGRNRSHRCQRNYFRLDRLPDVSGPVSTQLEGAGDFGSHHDSVWGRVVLAADDRSGCQLERSPVWFSIRCRSCQG